MQQWKYNRSVMLNLNVIMNAFALFHAMYKEAIFVVFTVLFILGMEVS